MHTYKSAAKKYGVHHNTLRNYSNPKSKYYDPNFPKPVPLNDFPNAAKRIPDDELETWWTMRKEVRNRA